MRKLVCSLILSGLLATSAGTVFAEENPLLNTVKPLFGTPYKSSGTSKKGFDCSGFTSYVFDSLGVKLPHSSAAQYSLGKQVPRKELQPGDLVFFQTNGRSVSHVGIYIGNNSFVHSESGRGVVKTNMNEPYYWKKRYVGAKRVNIPALQIAEAANAKKAVQAASIPEKQEPKKK